MIYPYYNRWKTYRHSYEDKNEYLYYSSVWGYEF